MDLKKLLVFGVIAYVGYEWLKVNSPSTLASLGLSGYPGAMEIPGGMGRVYLSGMGTIGQGYNINEQKMGDASNYELATKLLM